MIRRPAPGSRLFTAGSGQRNGHLAKNDCLLLKQTQYPPTHLLPILAEVLGASADELLGIKELNSDGNKKDMRLWRRFNQIEKLDAKEKRQILQLLDAFIEKKQLKRKIQSGLYS